MADKKYYGTETAKALNNFGSGVIPPGIIVAYAEVKEAALTAMQETDAYFPPQIFKAIQRTLNEIKEGQHAEHFPLSLKQGGAGTSLNMNINEVLAARAMEVAHTKGLEICIDPIEDINRFQSTNDTFPTALTIYYLRRLIAFERKVIDLQEMLVDREALYGRQLMVGRTELQSALPMTLGQVFASWSGMIERDRWRLHKIQERFRTIALGGTAIGTGFSAPQSYIFKAEQYLRSITGLPLSRSQNMGDEIAHSDKFSELANGIEQLGDNLFKITGDLLIYSSSMVGELQHPELQYGSSIMPSKVNPVMLEYAKGMCMETSHECAKVRDYAKNAQLQLNPLLPFLAQALNNAFDAVEAAAEALAQHFFPAMLVNQKKMESNLLQSNALFNALLPMLGYRKLKELHAKMQNNMPHDIKTFIREVAQITKLDVDILEKYFDPIELTTAQKG